MSQPDTPTILELLRAAVRETSSLSEAIKQFQALVWRGDDWEVGLSPTIVDALRDLAYDLEYFEPSVPVRAEDPSFFGEERAIREILDVLARVDSSRG